MNYFTNIVADYQDKNKAHKYVKIVFRNVDRLFVDEAGKDDIIRRIREHVATSNRLHPKCTPLHVCVFFEPEGDGSVYIEGCIYLSIYVAKDNQK